MLNIKQNYKRLAPGNIQDYQVGVFAFTKHRKLVLITSKKAESWILPKGNPEKTRSDREQAREEAFEEAGLEGTVNWKYYEFDVHGKVKKLRIFPMKVENLLDDYPEKNQRKRILIPFGKAEKIATKEMSGIIRKLRKVNF